MENKGTFAKDVVEGLSQNPKRLSSKYFYDDEGSRIFQEIMDLPEYYLTNSEGEILKMQSDDIIDSLGFKEEYTVVELGAGDGKKTYELLKKMVQRGDKVHYRPVDISSEAINLLNGHLSSQLPELILEPLIGDYFKVLKSLPSRSKPALFLFLGSNIGNYEKLEAEKLMRTFGSFLQEGDKMMIGFDIIKNPRVILSAYDDSEGITRKFNLNLLERMNRELQMDFQIDQFDFYPYYNPLTGELRSCIVSLEDQVVHSSLLDSKFKFEANEPIYTELSKKYSLEEIEEMASATGFKFERNFLDEKKYFADSLWGK